MKYLSIFIGILFFLSCEDPHNYRIKGHVSDTSLNGEYIYLQEIRDNKLFNIDSVIVSESSFEFKGIVDSAVIRELNFLHVESRVVNPLVFVLEPANLTAYIDTVSYIEGTPDNDALYQYTLDQRIYIRQLQTLMERYQQLIIEEKLTDSLQIAFQGEYNVLNQELNNLAYNFILLHDNSVAGALIFLQTYAYLTPSQVTTILEQAGPIFKKVSGISIIIEHFRKESLVSIGNPYINFSLPDTSGVNYSIDQFIKEKKWVLLDFWASWCAPCREDFPYILKAYDQFKDKGLEIIGISLDTQRNTWVKGIKRYKLPWLQLSDLKGWDSMAAQEYAIYAIPYTILINPEGKIVAKGLRQEMLLSELNKLIE